MRTDTNTSTVGILRVQNNNGLFVGAANVFNVNTTTTDANVKSNISGGNLIIQANVSGTTYNVASALGANGTFAVSNAATVGTTLGVTGNTTSGNLLTGGLVSATGNVTGGNLTTSALVQGATVSATGNVGRRQRQRKWIDFSCWQRYQCWQRFRLFYTWQRVTTHRPEPGR
jgi:hypothetical protein